jgi:hypothetical protein
MTNDEKNLLIAQDLIDSFYTPAKDEDHVIRPDITDINKILDNLDKAYGRNDAIRTYIYALRDLQHANDQSVFADTVDAQGKIDRATDAVRSAFDRLIVAEFLLNRVGQPPDIGR